jgi:periplasmic protein TonB
MPLALSLGAHALALAALAHFAPGTREPARDPEPVTVRLAPQPARTQAPVLPPQSMNRRALPAEAATAPDLPEARSLEEWLAEEPEASCASALEMPASARRSAIGVGALASLRAPHPSASETHAALAAPGPAVLACPRAEQVTGPIPLECAAPEYPAGAASVSEQGRVQLELAIDSSGRVESARVLHSSGFPRLDEAAQSCVRRWRFQPAQRDGVAITWRLEHTIVFRIASAPG